jgi:hypothetical protein
VIGQIYAKCGNVEIPSHVSNCGGRWEGILQSITKLFFAYGTYFYKYSSRLQRREDGWMKEIQ